MTKNPQIPDHTSETGTIPATLAVGKKRVPTLSLTAILFTLLGLLLGLLTGYNLNRPNASEPVSPAVTSTPSTAAAAQETWNETEQQEAISLASALVTAYISDYNTPATWQDSMAVFGTENFQSWTALADPSWVIKGNVTGIDEAAFTNEQNATVTVSTTVGRYPVKLIKDSDGKILVDEIVRQ